MNCTAFKILSALLSTSFSKEGGSFGAHGFWFRRCVYRGVRANLITVTTVPCKQRVHMRRWRDRLLMILENGDMVLKLLEEQEPMERCTGQGNTGRAAGWKVSSEVLQDQQKNVCL